MENSIPQKVIIWTDLLDETRYTRYLSRPKAIFHLREQIAVTRGQLDGLERELAAWETQ